jgi:alpha-glucosidase
VLSNHDRPRIVGRVGADQARIAAMLLLTLRGTPTVYYGDEIGMPQVPIPPDRVRDPFEKNVPGIGVGRDGARTPMQWDGSRHAGFSEVEPWLPLAADAASENVANQLADATSMLNLYRRLIALRRARPALATGSYKPIVAQGDLLLYVREQGTDRVLVALNLGPDATAVDFTATRFQGQVLLSSFADRDGEKLAGSIDLRGDEGLVIELPANVLTPETAGSA